MAWRPFYLQTLESLVPNIPLTARKGDEMFAIYMGPAMYMNKHLVPSPSYYQPNRSEEYPIAVSRGVWGKQGLRDSIIAEISHAPLGKRWRYRYSDWGFILLQQLVESLEGESLDKLAQREVYGPLGMTRTMFAPWSQGRQQACVPTENDLYFRKGIVRGYVHDMAAAMLGGVAGHAGLFSTADDLAKYGQMLLQRGEYGGKQVLASDIVDLFSSVPTKAGDNYRGYGFDKRRGPDKNSNYIGDSLSMASYGHIGFTGTILWIDPESDFVFVLLSNRTFPDSNNNILSRKRIRSQIMNALYMSVKSTILEADDAAQ